LIDSSLSYEENITNVKSYLGMGGRSEKKATRTMSAAECDVVIGNCQAGFVEDCKDACECGDPDACDVAGGTVSTPPTKKPAPAPKFKTVEDVKQWMEKKVGEYGSRNEFTCSSEYKKAYPKIKAIHDRARKQEKEERKQVHIIRNPYGTGHVIKFANTTNTYAGGGGMMGGISVFDTIDKAIKEAKRSGFQIMSKPKATKPSAAITPAHEEYLRKRDRIDKEQFERCGIGTPPTPRMPPLMDENVALRRSEGRNLVRQDVASMFAPPAPKRKPAAKPAKPKKTKPKKTKPKTTKPKAAAKPKPQKTDLKLTAAQRKRLNATGHVTVKRGGKFITITK